MIYNKYAFGFCPKHRAPKTLVISCKEGNKDTFCYVNEVIFGMPLRKATVALGTDSLLEGWNF